MKGMRIVGTGSALAQNCLTNDDIAKFVDTSDEWITSRTGIRQRYFCADDETHTSLCVRAGQKALESANIKPDQIAACIVATMSPDNFTPSAACLVQSALGIPEDTPCFDINAACSGFLYGMRVATGFFGDVNSPYVLLIGAEKMSRLLDMTDRTTCILFGDGAGAAILQESEKPIYMSLGSRGDDKVLLSSVEKKSISMEGQAVFRFATETVPNVVNDLLAQGDITMDDVDSVLCHQANKRILDFAIKRLKADPEKFYVNLDRFGNTSAASIPIALDEMVRGDILKRGMRFICVGFGGGLTWGGILMEY